MESNPQEQRFRCAVAVTLRRRVADLELLTAEVGTSGAFVRCEAAPPLNSLVRLVFTLPDAEGKLEVSAWIAAVLEPGQATDHPPGFEARFMGLSGEPRRRWDDLVRRLRRDQPDGRPTLVLARPSYVDRFRRKGLVALDAPLRPASSEALADLVDRQVLGGTLFVPTPIAIVAGAAINVQIVHPVTGEAFPIEGVVRRREVAPQPGVHVELTGLTPEVRVGLREFVDSVLVIEDYDVDVLAPAALRGVSSRA